VVEALGGGLWVLGSRYGQSCVLLRQVPVEERRMEAYMF